MGWIKKIWQKAKDIFVIADDKAIKLTRLAIKVTNAVKDIVDSPVDDIVLGVLKQVIKGQADDIVIDKGLAIIKTKLPVVIANLIIIDDLLSVSDPDLKVKLILDKIKFATDQQKNVFYHSLAATLIDQLSDGKLTFAECCITAEMVYQEMKKNNEL